MVDAHRDPESPHHTLWDHSPSPEWWGMAGNSVRGRNRPPAVVAVIDCGALICNLILYYSEHTQSKTHPERRMK